MTEVKLKPHAKKALEEIMDFKNNPKYYLDEEIYREYGKDVLNISGSARTKVDYLLKNKRLSPSFKRFLEKEQVDPEDLRQVMVYVKPLLSNKYLITLSLSNDEIEIEYQFTTDYRGLINFLQNV